MRSISAHGIIVETLRIIGDLIENVLNEITQTKSLCYACVQHYVDTALWLFPLYVGVSSVCQELFAFFGVVFDVLKSQMGAAAVEQAIQTFLAVFTKEQLAQTIVEDGAAGVRVVEKFLGILEFVVKEPGSSFRKFVPSTLSLCLQHIYPLVAEVSSVRLYNCMQWILNATYCFRSRLQT